MAISKRHLKDKCERCGSNENLTIDHIIPKVMLKMLCYPIINERENLQTLCKACNGLKGHSLDPKHPQTMRLLQKYVNRYEEMFIVKISPRKKYVWKMLTVKSLTPKTTYLEACDRKCQLELIYKKQHGKNN